MPSLSFMKRFVPRVERGEKLHSIRPRRANLGQWMPGKTVHLFFAMRTKYCRRIGRGVITELRDVVIFDTHLEIDGAAITAAADLDAFARADGFASWNDFLLFFGDYYGLPWEGHLIKWRLLPCA